MLSEGRYAPLTVFCMIYSRWINSLFIMKVTIALLCLVLSVTIQAGLADDECPSTLPTVPHAKLLEESVKSAYKDGSRLSYKCDFGYVEEGKISFLCENKKWMPFRKGRCFPKPCELPDETPNGQYELIVGEDFAFESKIKYTCNSGFQMVSKTDTRVCMTQGWSNHLPQCEVISCVLPPADGTIVVEEELENENVMQPGYVLTFKCNNSETMHLRGASKVWCTSHGNWSDAFPTCEDVTCVQGESSNTVIVTGLPEQNTTIKLGHQLHFSCANKKWHLKGVPQVVCKSNGEWSSAFPTCAERKDVCGRPPTVPFADTVINIKEIYQLGDRVQYKCLNFYKLEGEPQKSCVSGAWTGDFKCWEPCTVNLNLMKDRNIEFQFKGDKKLYSEHKDYISFKCVENKKLKQGSVDLRQQCFNGDMPLPSCE